jgi:hypothetical protein
LATAGGGVALTAVGAIFHLQAAAKADDVEDADGRWSDALADADAAGRRAETRAVVFYLLGGAALAAGGGLYVYGMTLAPRELEVAPTVSSDGAGISVRMSF